jgi:hypothetical protein
MDAARFRTLRSAVGIALLVALIGWVDLATGYEYQFFVFYFLPVALAAWGLGRTAGLLTATLCAAVLVVADIGSGHVYAEVAVLYWNWGIRVVAFLVIALTLAQLRSTLTEEHRLRVEVEQALHEVKQLRGLLPICSSCKSIRNDHGAWVQIEQYVRSHSQAEFTHGLCPKCVRSLYPDVADRILHESGVEQ